MILWALVWVDTAVAALPDALATMIAAEDSAARNAALFREMGRAATDEDRQTLGLLRLLVESLDRIELDDASFDEWLRAFGTADAEQRYRLLDHARRGGEGGPDGARAASPTPSASPAQAATPAPATPAPTGSLGPLFPPNPASAPGGGPGIEISHLRRLVALPDPGAAAVLSATVGFGAGHFYAQRPVEGWTFLGVEAAASTTLAAGLASSTEGSWSPVATGALVGLVVARLCDVALAPRSAHATAADAFR